MARSRHSGHSTPGTNHCFGCGKDNKDSMKLKFIYDEARDRFICRFRLGKRFTGPPRHCHGGIIATILDEAMAKLNKPRQVIAMTRQITVDYLKPVPLYTPLRVESAEVSVRGRRRMRTAEILTETGTVLAHSRGVFVTVDPHKVLARTQLDR